MSARDSKRSSRRKAPKSSVVGSTLGDTLARPGGRTLPRGGVRGKDGLKVAEGAMPDTTIIGTITASDGKSAVRDALRWTAIVSGGLVVVLVIVALVIAVLSRTSAFTIQSIKTYDSDHLKADDVARLVVLEDGATLLNVDEAAIERGVQKNPWVASIGIERWFPSTLRVVVQERNLGAVVAMGSGNHAWYLGDDSVWIEPCVLEVGENESYNDAALALASKSGVVLISDVPRSVKPEAGSRCTDSTLLAVQSMMSQFSNDFSARIIRYSAPSEDDISCMLENGVEIAMGSSSNVETKEAVAKRILSEYEGQLTYINVRVPSHPTYRRLNSDFVREGTGATGRSLDTKTLVEKVRAYKKDAASTEGQGTGTEGGYSDEQGSDGADAYSDGSSDYAGSGYDESTYDEAGGYDASDAVTYADGDATQTDYAEGDGYAGDGDYGAGDTGYDYDYAEDYTQDYSSDYSAGETSTEEWSEDYDYDGYGY